MSELSQGFIHATKKVFLLNVRHCARYRGQNGTSEIRFLSRQKGKQVSHDDHNWKLSFKGPLIWGKGGAVKIVPGKESES